MSIHFFILTMSIADTTRNTCISNYAQLCGSCRFVLSILTIGFGQDLEEPFGSFDTPLNGSTVRSSIPVTGWALDDVAVESVKIFRNPVSGEGDDWVYIGAGVFVEGARTDIEQAFPGYPDNSRAGWGYMLLTNFLPNGGNGTFTLYAVVRDSAGNEVTLGSKTIFCDNTFLAWW